MTAREAVRRRELNDDHNAMMTEATAIYNAVPWSLGKQDLARNRAEIAEALVGEFGS